MKYVLIFLLLVIIELIYFKIADKFNIIDKPNERSSHTGIIIRGGGIIFTLGVLLYAAFFGFPYPWFICGLTLISIVSFIDDTREISFKIRIIVQFLAMSMMLYQLGLFGQYPWWHFVLALIICTGIINAYNFMDGINGITGGYSTITVITLWYINYYFFSFTDGHLLLVLLLALIVFNFFNFRTKAKCFAGDVGSVSMAFILIFIVGQLIVETQNLAFIILFGLYGVDSVLTIIHRLMLKENIFEAHRKHAYQLMSNELKVPQIGTSSIYMLIQGLMNIGFLYIWKHHPAYQFPYLFITLGILAIAYILFMKKYYHLHENKKR